MRRLVLALILGAAMLLLPPGEPAVAQPTTLPAPDFDNDGFGDLAVGVPGEDVGADGGAGAVVLLFGSAAGLGGGGVQLHHQGTGGLGGSAESGDAVGAVLG
jgi:FG-GAP repeat